MLHLLILKVSVFVKISVWILDSGTFDHNCCDINIFKHYDHINIKPNTIVIPDGLHVKIKCIRSVSLNNGLKLKKVLYVLGFQYKIDLYTYILCQYQNAKIIFVTNIYIYIRKVPLMYPLLLGRLRNNLYYLEDKLILANDNKHTQMTKLLFMSIHDISENKGPHSYTTCLQSRGCNNAEIAKLWHFTLGHTPFNRLHVIIHD